MLFIYLFIIHFDLDFLQMILTGVMGIIASFKNKLFVSNLNSRKLRKKTPSFLLCITVLFTKLFLWFKYLFIDWMIDQITTKSGGAARIKGNGAYYVFYSGHHYKQIQSYLSIHKWRE